MTIWLNRLTYALSLRHRLSIYISASSVIRKSLRECLEKAHSENDRRLSGRLPTDADDRPTGGVDPLLTATSGSY